MASSKKKKGEEFLNVKGKGDDAEMLDVQAERWESAFYSRRDTFIYDRARLAYQRKRRCGNIPMGQIKYGGNLQKAIVPDLSVQAVISWLDKPVRQKLPYNIQFTAIKILADRGELTLERFQQFEVCNMNFILLDNLNEPDITGFLKTAAEYKGLEIISLKNSKFLCGTAIQQLYSLKHLRMLDLTGCQTIDDDVMASLGGLEKLQTLILNEANVSYKSLEIFCNSPPPLFKDLYLSNTVISDNAVMLLHKIPTLTNLHMSNSVSLNYKGLELITALSHLNLSNAGAALNLSNFQMLKLEKLNLGGTYVQDMEIQSLVGMPLVELSLSFCSHITDAAMEYIATLEKLKKLNISGTSITNEGLEKLSSRAKIIYLSYEDCHSLEELDLSYCKSITDDGMKYVGYLQNLYKLFLSGTNVTNKGLEQHFISVYMKCIVCLKLGHLCILAVDDTKVDVSSLPDVFKAPIYSARNIVPIQ